MGIEPIGSLQALVFAALFSAVVSMPEDQILNAFAVSKKDLVDNFQQGAETALGSANLLRTTRLETMQAFIMYMVRIHFLQDVSAKLTVSDPLVSRPNISCPLCACWHGY